MMKFFVLSVLMFNVCVVVFFDVCASASCRCRFFSSFRALVFSFEGNVCMM